MTKINSFSTDETENSNLLLFFSSFQKESLLKHRHAICNMKLEKTKNLSCDSFIVCFSPCLCFCIYFTGDSVVDQNIFVLDSQSS